MPEEALVGHASPRPHAVAVLHRPALALAALLLALTPSDGARAARQGNSHRGATVRADRLEGVVFEDRNANGVRDAREPGVEGAWVAWVDVIDDTSGTPAASAISGADGAYSLPRPQAGRLGMLQCVPAPGYRPEGSSVRTFDAFAADTLAMAPRRADFGLTAFRRLTLRCDDVQCIGTVDLGERDPARLRSDPDLADDDLVVGTEASQLDRLLVWFARRDANPFLSGGRDYAREVPAAVRSIAVLDLEQDGASHPEVVIGTRHTAAGNFFTWFPQSFPSNEGYLPAHWSQACRTQDRGDVQALAVSPPDGASSGHSELFVGTRSPGGGGTIECWSTDPASPKSWSRAERYPESGSPDLGAVTSLALARLGASGEGGSGEDLIVGTESAGHGGAVTVLGRSGDGNARLVPRFGRNDLGTAVRCVVTADVTGDSRPDLILGLQETASTGRLELWRNDTFADALEFTKVRSIPTRGVPWSLLASDLGGLPGPDVAVGFREDDRHFGGRVEIYYCDAGTLPLRGSDPSAGTVSGWVPALGVGRFRSASPRHSGSPPRDLIAGVRSGPSRGQVQVFVR